MKRGPRTTRPATIARLAILLLAPTLLAACSGGRFGQPDPASTQGTHTLALWRVFIVAGCAVGGTVLGLILYVAIRFRRRSDEVPSQKSSNIRWEAAYTIAPVMIVAILFGFSVATQSKTDRSVDPPDLTVNVIGFQWGWQFQYPEQGVTVTGSGSAGEQPTLVLPLGETVRLVLRTTDVIHSFWVPEFLTKRDLIPGIDNSIEVTPNRLGTFDGHCAEYCLIDHWRMSFVLQVVPPDQFAAELASAAAATHGGPR